MQNIQYSIFNFKRFYDKKTSMNLRTQQGYQGIEKFSPVWKQSLEFGFPCLRAQYSLWSQHKYLQSLITMRWKIMAALSVLQENAVPCHGRKNANRGIFLVLEILFLCCIIANIYFQGKKNFFKTFLWQSLDQKLLLPSRKVASFNQQFCIVNIFGPRSMLLEEHEQCY